MHRIEIARVSLLIICRVAARLGADIAHGPALSILLELYLMPDGVATKDIAVGSAIAPQIMARWLRILEGKGLIVRENGCQRLSELGRGQMAACLSGEVIPFMP